MDRVEDKKMVMVKHLEWYKDMWSGKEEKPHLYINNRKFYVDTVVMQYTGLKDKNAKEIYEGDVVVWEYELFGRKDSMKETITWKNYHDFIDSEELETMEVIGNIYENPKLK